MAVVRNPLGAGIDPHVRAGIDLAYLAAVVDGYPPFSLCSEAGPAQAASGLPLAV